MGVARLDWGKLGLLSLLWGGSFFFVEIALTGLPPLAVVWLRVAIGACGLGLVMGASGKAFPRGRAVWVALAGMGFLNNALPFTLFALAQGQISGGLAAILNATTPLFTLVVMHLFTRDERITPARALGLVAGLGGVVVMMWGRGGDQGWDGVLWAKGACLAAALSYGLAGVWSRRFLRLGVAPMQMAFGQCASATLMLAPVLTVALPRDMALPGASVWLAMAGLGGLSTVVAYLLFFSILAAGGAVRLSLVTFLIPVSATALGVAFLDQLPEGRHVAGFALIALGLVAVGRRSKAPVRAASAGSSRSAEAPSPAISRGGTGYR
ncbi:MAG: hypothetical protein RIT14_2157 [Pseudomonadota bacterium]